MQQTGAENERIRRLAERRLTSGRNPKTPAWHEGEDPRCSSGREGSAFRAEALGWDGCSPPDRRGRRGGVDNGANKKRSDGCADFKPGLAYSACRSGQIGQEPSTRNSLICP